MSRKSLISMEIAKVRRGLDGPLCPMRVGVGQSVSLTTGASMTSVLCGELRPQLWNEVV